MSPTEAPANAPDLERMAELRQRRTPYVHALVVRVEAPTSARAGDQALVFADGTIEGFVGGQCAAGSVRVAAQEVLASGIGVLLKVLPEDDLLPVPPGVTAVVNPCLSGGAVEIFLNPVLPPPVIELSGESPVARSLRELAPLVGFTISDAGTPGSTAGAVATVIASHGGNEAAMIRNALAADVPWVGLVASLRRGAAVLEELELSAVDRARVHTPAGLDLGAKTPSEVALSILAAIIQAVRREGIVPAPEADAELAEDSPDDSPDDHRPAAPADASEQPLTAIDPICGMTVTITADTPHLVVDGVDYWFCCPGCRHKFAATSGT
ncbi:MAG: XdhC family protein [Nocardioides sp.]